MSATKRYSDLELEEFKKRIEQKLELARTDLNFFLAQIQDISDNMGNDGDWMDDSSNHNDLEMANSMASRQKKHIIDLENALIRIRKKSYGICILTGELIDARRLMAVPTTTKSLAAKTAIPVKEERKRRISIPINTQQPTIITKVIRKPNPKVLPIVNDDDIDDDLILDDDYFEDLEKYGSGEVEDNY